MNESTIKFEESIGPRNGTQLLIGVVGPSGSGKTESSLRLATGIQRVAGGDIGVLDSENQRARHYDDKYKFRHAKFPGPFTPANYRAGIEFLQSKGCKTVITDSTSHLHEGKGGQLEWHQNEVDRIMQAWKCSEEKANVPAWGRPKRALREFIDWFTQQDVHLIFCFKARDKLKLGGGKVVSMGWMPIASEELVFELTAKVLLLPGAGGVPTLNSNEIGEKMMIKLPGYLKAYFTGAAGKPIDEDLGEKLARWSLGSSQASTEPVKPPTAAEYEACDKVATLAALEDRRRATWATLKGEEKAALKAAADAAQKRIVIDKPADKPADEKPTAPPIGDDAAMMTSIQAFTTAPELAAFMKAAVDAYAAADREMPFEISVKANEMREHLEAM